MATLILTTVAAVATAGQSLWIQAAVQTLAVYAGASIDSAIFGPKVHNTGPRLSDLTVQVSSYGQPIPRIYGEANRVAGNVIWSPGLRETATTEKQGGKGGGGSVTTTSYSYDTDAAIAICKGPIVGVGRIWADGKLFRDAAGVQKQAGAVRVYLGDEAQTPDPLMQAALGVDATPAFRGTAYVVFEALQLADFGNRLPIFTFEVICAQTTVEAIVTDLCLAAGLEASEFDAAGVEASDVAGYVIGSPSSARAALEPLRQAFFFDVTEREGRLTFFRSDRAADYKIPKGHLAAHEDGGQRPRDYEFDRVADLEQPREIIVQFNDPARDYQPNAERARRSTGLSASDVSVDLPITLDVATAKAIAEQMMSQSRLRKDSVTVSLPTRYLFAEPGDKFVLPLDDGRERTIRVESKTDFLPGRVELKGRQDGSAALRKVTASAAQPAVPAQAVLLPGPAFLELMDLPLLRDEDDGPGFYAAAGGYAAGFIGSALYRSTDAGVSYDRFVDFLPIATLGTTLNSLRNDVDPEVWDEASVVDVNLLNPSAGLESVTRDQVLSGANAAVIGDEVVQFRTASLISAGTYRLSGFLRGRKGTEDQIPGQVTGQRFVLLSSALVVRAPAVLADVGLACRFKAVSLGTPVSAAAAVGFTNTGRGLKPLAPTQLRHAPGAGGDVVLTWVRRTRLDAPWRDLVEAPLGETTEAYEVHIVDGGGIVKRVLTATTPTVTYLAADQVTDFGGATPNPHWRVAEVSTRVGPGLYASSDFVRATPPAPWARARSTIDTATTNPATSTSSVPTIAGGLNISPAHPAFRYHGSDVTVSGTLAFGSATASRPREAAINGPMPLVVEFMYDGASIEVHHASDNIQLWADGEIALATGRGFIDTAFVDEWRRYDFADARKRRLRLVMMVSFFSGVRIEPGRIIRPPPDLKNARLILQGDSYTVGALADPWASGFAHQLGQLFECDAWPSAVGGTGYLSPYTAGGPGNYKYRDRLASDVFPYIRDDKDALLVLGGLNDRSVIDASYTNAAFDAEVALYYADVLANVPQARVVVGSIWSHPATNADAECLHRNGTLKTLAAANSWPFIDMIAGATYDRAGVAFAGAAGPWFPDYSLIDADMVHPTGAGHDYLAVKLLAELELALQDYN